MFIQGGMTDICSIFLTSQESGSLSHHKGHHNPAMVFHLLAIVINIFSNMEEVNLGRNVSQQ